MYEKKESRMYEKKENPEWVQGLRPKQFEAYDSYQLRWKAMRGSDWRGRVYKMIFEKLSDFNGDV